MAQIEIPDQTVQIVLDYDYEAPSGFGGAPVRGAVRVCQIDVWYGSWHHWDEQGDYHENALEEAQQRLASALAKLLA